MTDAIPIPIYPWPVDEHGSFTALEPERAALLREAKARIDTPLKIYPVPAVPGSPGRTLAFGSIPPHYATTARISAENVGKVESVEGALRAILFATDDSAFFTGEDWMAALIPGVKYAGEEPWPPPAGRTVYGAQNNTVSFT